MAEILFASHNSGKLAEIKTLLAPMGVKILTSNEVGIPNDFDVDETGATFTENAELKTRAFAGQLFPASFTDLWILADDGGLMVDALNGSPGVHSKRFISGNDHDRNREVLKRLAEITDPQKRKAHYESIFCLLKLGSPDAHFFKGEMYGQIGFEEKGAAGFGYDFIFIPDGYQNTIGELGIEIKNKLSHRAHAVQELINFWKENISTISSS